MSQHPDTDNIFEANVRALLRQPRPFERVAPAASERMEARVVEHAAELAAARGKPRRAVSRPRPLILAFTAAAAALLLAWFGASRLLSSGPGQPSGERNGQERDGIGALAELDPGSTPEDLAADGGSDDSTSSAERTGVELVETPVPAGNALAATAGPRLLLELQVPDGTSTPDELQLVLLRQVPLPAVPQPEFLTATVEDGNARVSLAETGTFDVHVRGFGGLAAWRERGVEVPADGELTLRVDLRPGAVVRGRVLDAAGRPLAGATVISRTDLPLAVTLGGGEQARELGAPVTLTGADGRFVLEGVTPGRIQLRAGAPGHAPHWFEAESRTQASGAEAQLDTGELTVQLDAQARVAGSALYGDGTPANDAWVIISINDEQQRPRYYQEGRVDLNGRFEMDELPAGPGVALAFSERHSSGPPLAFRGLVLTAGATETVEFELGAAAPAAGTVNSARIEGRLQAADGTPVVGRAIFAMRANSDGEAINEPNWRATLTEENGDFTLTELPAGPLVLFASDDVRRSMLRLGGVEIAEGRTRRAEYRLGRRRLLVAARDGDNALPAAYAMLFAEAPDPAAGLLVSMARIDAEGRALFEELGAGPYRVDLALVSQEHAVPSRSGLVPSASDEALIVDAVGAGTLRIELFDADGRPASGIKLEFTQPDGLPAHIGWGPPTTDENGIAEFTGLVPGSWTVAAPELSKSGSVFLRSGDSSTLRL